MNTHAKTALILGPAVLFPLGVFLLARQHSEGPFGNAFEMLAVMELGGVAALIYAVVAGLRVRARRGGAAPWFLAAGIALSPIAYFVLWNAFFRAD